MPFLIADDLASTAYTECRQCSRNVERAPTAPNTWATLDKLRRCYVVAVFIALMLPLDGVSLADENAAALPSTLSEDAGVRDDDLQCALSNCRTWPDALTLIEKDTQDHLTGVPLADWSTVVQFKGIYFTNTKQYAGAFRLPSLKKALRFTNCKFDSPIDFSGSDLNSVAFENCDLVALIGTNGTASKGVVLTRCTVRGGVVLDQSTFGRLEVSDSLICGHSDPDGRNWGINASESVTRTHITIIRSRIHGGLELLRSNIGTRLLVKESVIDGEIAMDQCTIAKSLSVKDSLVWSLRAPLALIAGNVDLEGSHFLPPKNYPAESGIIYLGGARIDGSFHTDDLRCTGKINLSDCRIGAGLNLIASTEPEAIDLTSTTCHRLRFVGSMLPAQRLVCTGFTFSDIDYDEMGGRQGSGSSVGVLCRLFCDRAADSNRHFAIYRKFASCLENHGDTSTARNLRIAAEERKYRASLDVPTSWLWHKVGWFVGYGYKPLWAALAGLVWIVLAAIVLFVSVFARWLEVIPGDATNLPWTPWPRDFWTACAALAGFSLVYSLDTFIPLVDLGHAGRYRVGVPAKLHLVGWVGLAKNRIGRAVWTALVHVCYIVHVYAGWFLATLFVGGVSGLLTPS